VPPTPGFATAVSAIENSWTSKIPVVDFIAASSWDTGEAYISNEPFVPGPVTMDYPAYIGPAASQSAAITLAALFGGTLVWALPTQAQYAMFYQDPGAVAGTLQPVVSLQAQVPLGPNGALVEATALVADILRAMFYGRGLGIQQALLNCFVV